MEQESRYKKRLFRGYLAVAVVPAAFFLILGTVSVILSLVYVSRELTAINRAALEQLREGSGKIQLTDNAGNVLAEAGGTQNGEGSKESFVEYKTAFNQYPFALKAMIPRGEYYHLPLTLALISAVSSLTAFVLGLGAAYGLSRRSFRSIAAIIDIIEAANRGDSLPEPAIPPRNGYHDLVYSILKTFVERRFLKLQLSERELREKTLELLALQSQMNPHFLFNTLTSISCGALAFTNGPNTVTDMIGHLAHRFPEISDGRGGHDGFERVNRDRRP